MTWSLPATIGLLAGAIALPGQVSPASWSPDGQWLAFTTASDQQLGRFSPGWLLRFPVSRPASHVESSAGSPLHFRLYTHETATAAKLLVAESADPLSAPAWRFDGRALAYTRLKSDAGDACRIEVVVVDQQDRDREVASVPGGKYPASLTISTLPPPMWSPDGRYVAAPFPDDRGFVILRADNGRVMKTVDEGRWPSWSPNGSRFAFVTLGQTDAVHVIDGGFGPERKLAEVGRMSQPPAWSRDGKSLLAVTRRTTQRSRVTFSLTELVRIQPESGQVETLARLSTDPAGPDVKEPATWWALSPDGEELHYAQDADGQPSSLVLFRPRNGETVKRYHPVDFSVGIRSLSLAPGGRFLAVRFGRAGGRSSPLGLIDLTTGQLSPVLPDDPSRLEWVKLLLATGLDLLATGLPQPSVDRRPVERPTVLPVPGEIPVNQELHFRLRTVGNLGQPVSAGDPSRGGARDPEVDRCLQESRLFFNAIRGEYSEAVVDLNGLEGSIRTADERLGLLYVRAQLLAGKGETGRASDLIAILQEFEGRRPRMIEWTPTGYVLSGEPKSAPGFASYLLARLAGNSPGAQTNSVNPAAQRVPRFFSPPPLPGNPMLPGGNPVFPGVVPGGFPPPPVPPVFPRPVPFAPR